MAKNNMPYQSQSRVRGANQNHALSIAFYGLILLFSLLGLYYSKSDVDQQVDSDMNPEGRLPAIPLHGNVTTGQWQGEGVNLYMPNGVILRRQDNISPLLTFLFNELFGLMSGKSIVVALSMDPILNAMAGWLNQTTLSVGSNQYELSYGQCYMPYKLFSEDDLSIGEGEVFDDRIACLASNTSQSRVSEVACMVRLFRSDAVLPMTLFANKSAASYAKYPCAMPAPAGNDTFPTLEVRTMAMLWQHSPQILQHYLSSKDAVYLPDNPDDFEDALLDQRAKLEALSLQETPQGESLAASPRP